MTTKEKNLQQLQACYDELETKKKEHTKLSQKIAAVFSSENAVAGINPPPGQLEDAELLKKEIEKIENQIILLKA